MPDTGILLAGAGVLLMAGILLTRSLRRAPQTSSRDLYLEALEAWVSGEKKLADELLRELITAEPDSVDPYLQLGNLLRSMGQSRKAAIIHRGLAARPELSQAKQIQVGLSLAEDLLEQGDHHGAGLVLDTLVRRASSSPRYWWCRFRQWVLAGDLVEAVRALEHAASHVENSRRDLFRQSMGFFQLDRAYGEALAGNHKSAASLLHKIPAGSKAMDAAPLVEAIIQVARGQLNLALETAAIGMGDQPKLQVAFHHFLREQLLENGQFARAIPLLEKICEGDSVPMVLIMELVMLYEKTGQRQKALDLIQNKQGLEEFTPNATAAFLSVLIREFGRGDLEIVWNSCKLPAPQAGWHCPGCGQNSPRLSWFCPRCFSFQTFNEIPMEREVLPCTS